MLNLECFSDADRAGNLDHRKSTSSYCFKLSSSSAVVSWSKKVKRCVATSTAEAEMNSLVDATREAIHLRDLLQDLALRYKNLLRFSLTTRHAKHSASSPLTMEKQNALRLNFIS